MLTLNDGRSELWQWDTGRKLTVDADCTQVHFSNKFFGRSVDVDVVDGVAEIPDVLLQADKDLLAWAFVGTSENGYTKISKVFKVNKRNKPADYVFTPTEQTTLDEIMKRLSQIEESQDPDAIKNAVDEYLANNPIQVEEKDPNVPDWAKQPTKPEYTAQEVGAVATVNGIAPDENGNVQIPVSGGNADQSGLTQAQISALDGMFKICAYTADAKDAYKAFQNAFGIGGEVEPDEPDVPVVPDEPDAEKTLTSISAVYSGGDVAVGTAISDLTGIVVTAHYSDGTSEIVTGYTLSGTIAEGSNTITVSYGGKTTTFTVTGEAEESNLEQYEYTIAGTGNLNNTGGVNAHGLYNYIDFIELDSAYNAMTIAVYFDTAVDTNASVFYAVQWFNGDTFLNHNSGQCNVEAGSNKNVIPFTVPDGATKFRVSVQNNCERFALFKGTVTADQI